MVSQGGQGVGFWNAGAALTELLRNGAGYAAGLRAFLRERLPVEESLARLRRRISRREESFLRLVSEGILANPANPYCRMLRGAGIEVRQIRRLTRERGVEGALAVLREEGVYLSVEEFKGMRPLVRRGREIDFHRSALANPLAPATVKVSTSGSFSPVTIPVSFPYLAGSAVNMGLILHAQGMLEAPLMLWFPMLPNPAGLLGCLAYWKGGGNPTRWFVQTRRVSRWFFSAATRATVWLARMWDRRIPRPEEVPLDRPGPAVRAMRAAIDRMGRCVLYTYSSSAIRLCRHARAEGISLEGVLVLATGEPLTPGRRELIEATGARAAQAYWTTEAGLVGASCGTGQQGDDMHVWQDRLAVLKAPAAGSGDPVLYFTSLLREAPLTFLNLEVGDTAELRHGRCGCPLGRAGLHLRVSNVHSVRRITAHGMTLPVSDLVPLVDRVLPGRFGGDAGDYQILERVGDEETRIILRVDPRLGEIPEEGLRTQFRDYLADRYSLAGDLWASAGAIEVQRRPPAATPGGKVQPVQILHGPPA